MFLLVILLVLRLVSVTVLWFALPAVGCALLLPAVGYALLPAVGYALLDVERCSASASSLLLLYLLFTTGSSAVVQSRILTTCSLAVAPSVFLSHHWLLGRDTLW